MYFSLFVILSFFEIIYASPKSSCKVQNRNSTEVHLSRQKRLIGAEYATDDFPSPFVVAIEYKSQVKKNNIDFICAGAIYNIWYIITTAECIDKLDAEDLEVRVGSSYKLAKGKLFGVAKIILHNNYSSTKGLFANNIGLLKLDEGIVSDEDKSLTRSIPLWDGPFEGELKANVFGWGKTKDESDIETDGESDTETEDETPQLVHLQNIIVYKVNPACCQKCWTGIAKVPPKTICAGSRSVEVRKHVGLGDSGGPLIVKTEGELVGIVGSKLDGYCPDVYASALSFKNWIRSKAGEPGFHTASSSSRQKRLVTGVPIKETDDFSFVAAIEYKYDKGGSHALRCGASIYNKWYVITAAHCVHEKNKKFIEVRVGSSLITTKGETHNVIEIIKHEGYNEDTIIYSNDIALLKLETPINEDQKIRAIKLYDMPIKNESLTVFGWSNAETSGSEKHKLQKLEVDLINFDECTACWKKKFEIPKDVFCASTSLGPDGDFGDPLFKNGKLVGLAYRGFHGKCPDLFMNVSYFKDWIVKNAV